MPTIKTGESRFKGTMRKMTGIHCKIKHCKHSQNSIGYLENFCIHCECKFVKMEYK